MIEQTKQMMSTMKFYGMLKSIDIRLHEASSNGWGATELISALVTDEKLYRDEQTMKRRLRLAQFRTDASLERFDYTAKRNLTKAQVSELKSLKFLKDPRNVILMGPTGVGKTYLATAIGEHACREGYSAIFMGMNLFIEKTLMSRSDGSFMRFREKLIRTDLLILDDLGIKKLPPTAVQDFYDILEERYQSKATMITSQLPIPNWKEVIEDQVALEAILDRLIHGSVRLEIKGESYRKKRGNDGKVDKE